MTKRIVPVALVALALVAASCGSDDETTTATDGGETTAASSAPAATDAPTATDAPSGGDAATTTVAPAGDCSLDSPLKIGFAADLGELGAFSDGPGSDAAEVQVALLNDAGGVGGLPIEYEVKDIQGDPSATQRAAQELLDGGVSAIIGPPFANTGAPLATTVDGQVPIVYMASTDPSLADAENGQFLASFSDPVQAAAAAEFMIGRGMTTAITFSSPDDVYFSGNPEYFAAAFENGGGEVVQDFSFSLADEDFSTQVNEIAALDPQPEVLFTAMVMPQIATLLEQLQAAGVELSVIGADAFDATVVWGAGEVAEGVFFAAHTFPSDDNDVQAFLDAATAAGKDIETVSFGALSADAVQIIAAAATAACTTDGPALSAAIAELTDLAVTTGTVTYAGTNGVPEKDVAILEVKDGAPALAETLRPAFIPEA
jgi:branched-chain amino acid transport system substrate-binding protein